MPGPGLVWLLDKDVTRRAIEGIAASLLVLPLTNEQRLAVSLLVHGRQANIDLCITPEVANILSRYPAALAVRLFLAEVEVMQRGRYFKRWARRLQEHAFAYEDAKMLSYGTFGLALRGLVMGASVLISFDKALVNNFAAQEAVLVRRLRAMTAHLPAPYHDARLPAVSTPQDMLQAYERHLLP